LALIQGPPYYSSRYEYEVFLPPGWELKRDESEVDRVYFESPGGFVVVLASQGNVFVDAWAWEDFITGYAKSVFSSEYEFQVVQRIEGRSEQGGSELFLRYFFTGAEGRCDSMFIARYIGNRPIELDAFGWTCLWEIEGWEGIDSIIASLKASPG